MTAQQKYSLTTEPKCVLVSGPEESDMDGGAEYTVCFGDDNGEVIDENKEAIWFLWEFEEAVDFGWKLAGRYKLEYVNEAMPV